MKPEVISHLLCFVGFLDLLAVSMIIPLIPNQILNLGANSVVVGFIGSLYGGVQLFSSPIVGSWSDIKGRKFVLVFCLLTSGLSYFLLGCSSFLFLLIISRILLGCLKHSQTLLTSYIAGIVSKEERSKYYGYFNGISNIGFIVGPTFGGQLAEFPNGFFWVSCVVTLLFFTNAFIIWYIMPEPKEKTSELKIQRDHQKKSPTTINNYFKDFRSDLNDCWDIMAYRLILGFSTLIYRSNFSLVLKQKYDFSPKYVGYLTSFQGVVSTFAGLVAGNLTQLDKNPERQVLYGVLTLTISLIGITAAHSILILVCSLTILSISTSFLRVCLNSVLASRCHKDKLGAVVGVGQSVTSMARMLAPMMGGIALQSGFNGPSLVGSISSGCGLLLSIYLCIYPISKKPKAD